MAEENDGAEKSFDASAQKIRQARQKGNVPQSPELMTFARFTGIMVALVGVIAALATKAAERLSGFLINPYESSALLFKGGSVLEIFGPVTWFFIGALGFAMVFTAVALVAQQAITFSPSKLTPDINKINPIKNVGKKYGTPALLDFLKSLVKVIVVTIVGIFICVQAMPEMMASIGAPAALMAIEMKSLLTSVILAAVLMTAVAAGIDVPLKWSQHRDKLKMSRQEMIDEAKETDGDPEQKRARLAQARSIAQNRQLEDVPSADVVIVNPQHYAVALKWKRDGSEVPRCVAKGIDHIALQIRMKAEAANVPIYRNVATARSLYAAVDVGEEIRREHYEAVAAAIRFADKLRKTPSAYE